MAHDDVYLLRPLNMSEPTAEDRRHSRELEEVRMPLAVSRACLVPPREVLDLKSVHRCVVQYLKSQDLFESLAEAELREEILGLFDQIVQRWIKGVAQRKGFSAEDARAHVFTFGSYRLGVNGPGAWCLLSML